MLPIAGQTAGPNGLHFFVWKLTGVSWAKKLEIIFFNCFFQRATSGLLVSIK